MPTTMQFTTPTHIGPLQPRIEHHHQLTVIGSCFADHIGGRLMRMKWRTECNPFGVLYNPHSIAEALNALIDCRTLTGDDLVHFPDGGWNTWLHHSAYSNPDKAEALTNINNSTQRAARHLSLTDTLVITLGTAWVYRLKEDGRIVGNCHKMPEQTFIRQRLDTADIVSEYTVLLNRLWSLNPNMRIIFTVSPVRHLKDTLHGNQLSKSTLLLAIDELCRIFPKKTHYFPAYEIVIDELRDYRFYADDMAHPSPQAVEYVWQQFVEHCIDAKAKTFMDKWSKLLRALEHRPFRPNSEQHKQFIKQTQQKLHEMKESYPHIDIHHELFLCHAEGKIERGFGYEKHISYFCE